MKTRTWTMIALVFGLACPLAGCNTTTPTTETTPLAETLVETAESAPAPANGYTPTPGVYPGAVPVRPVNIDGMTQREIFIQADHVYRRYWYLVSLMNETGHYQHLPEFEKMITPDEIGRAYRSLDRENITQTVIKNATDITRWTRPATIELEEDEVIALESCRDTRGTVAEYNTGELVPGQVLNEIVAFSMEDDYLKISRYIGQKVEECEFTEDLLPE